MWNYTWRTGVDENGETLHNGMYSHLWSNAPKELHELPDYSYEKHFGQNVGSYPPRVAIRDYLFGYFKHSKLDESAIRLSTTVTNVEWLADQTQFKVSVKDNKAGKKYSELFDYVVVANGHFSTPNVPEFPGIHEFQGSVLHSHDFRSGTAYKNQRVCLVGGSYSAEDIASQCYKFGANHCIISHRKKDAEGNWQMSPHAWPEGIAEKPLIKEVKLNSVVFHDGTEEPVDAIILCTGYRHNFPFLSDDLMLNCKN